MIKINAEGDIRLAGIQAKGKGAVRSANKYNPRLNVGRLKNSFGES